MGVGVMPYRKTDRPKRAKPWIAIKQRNGKRYYIGSYKTKNEAEDAERGFELSWPRRKNQYA
jgi:hypothetical protein